VNTAPAEVLASLSDEMSLPAAEAIVAWRLRPGPDGRPQGFAKVEELKSVPGVTGAVYDSISPALSVKSSIFEIRVRSSIQNIEKAWIYVVRRGSGAKGELTLLSQQRLNDFLSVRPPGEADGSSK
jgi:type II secretory pathway component PulK